MPDPAYCAPGSTSCTFNPMHPNPNISVRPSSCLSGDSNCSTNNPYGSSYLDIYDPTYQNYASGVSFLAQFGRDQQTGPFTTSLTPQGSPTNGAYFPNGIYPFFWLMNYYSPEVDNIDPTKLQPSQVHWCVAGGTVPSAGAAPVGYPDLAQLSLPYSCQGQDCCVNYLLNSVSNSASVTSNPITVTLIPGPVVQITSPSDGSYFAAGSDLTITAAASEASPGSIMNVSLYDKTSGNLITSLSAPPYTYTTTTTDAGTRAIYAVATDNNNVSATSALIVVNVIPAPTVNITVPGSLTAGSQAAITANASTSAQDDSISSVTFYNNGVILGASGSSPYSYSWTVPASGTSYSLTAVATDAHGISTTSSAVTGKVP